ncbi:unnamed protein product [Gadus morhua 'NCC']
MFHTNTIELLRPTLFDACLNVFHVKERFSETQATSEPPALNSKNAGPVQPEDHDQIDGPSSPGVNTQTDGPCNPGDIWRDAVVESEMLPITADSLKAMSTTPSDISLRALFNSLKRK